MTEKGYRKRRCFLLRAFQCSSDVYSRARTSSLNSVDTRNSSLRSYDNNGRTHSYVASPRRNHSISSKPGSIKGSAAPSLYGTECDHIFGDSNVEYHPTTTSYPHFADFTSSIGHSGNLSRSGTSHSKLSFTNPFLQSQNVQFSGREPEGLLPQQLPLDPRGLGEHIYDPHDPNTRLNKYQDLGAILRLRGNKIPKKLAYMMLDSKGKEVASITWDKFSSRVEKLSLLIKEKSGLYRGDRVALVYREEEIIEFAIAFMSCLTAGVVAVPINNSNEFQELNLILSSTQCHLALTTEINLKTFQRELITSNLQWPKGVEWWKTNDLGTFVHKKGSELPDIVVADLAYIEFSKSPVGEIRGVVISHKTILHQMACLQSIIESASNTGKETMDDSSLDLPSYSPGISSQGEVLLTYLDFRQSIGLLSCILLGVYGGQSTIWCGTQVITLPGLFAYLITKYKASLVLADYPGLKTAAFNYQTSPMQTRNYSRKCPIDFSGLKLCMIDCLTVDPEFHDILGDRWLKPLGIFVGVI